jgi:RNA polymerase sigma-70 factor (ECF subfamily)
MARDAMDVAQSLAAARAGAREVLGELLDLCRGYLLLVAQQELNADLRGKGGASDLVQETFLEAQRDFAQFQGTSETELLAWLRRLLLNNLANFSRRFRATGKRAIAREVGLEGAGSGPHLVDGLVAGNSTPSSLVTAQEQTEILRGALERLPDDYRQVILLRYHEERSFEDIAGLMQRSANAVRKLWLRAIDRLQKDMEIPR